MLIIHKTCNFLSTEEKDFDDKYSINYAKKLPVLPNHCIVLLFDINIRKIQEILLVCQREESKDQ
jgi:hypothetical protein